jgi:hypothetical protein
MLEKFDIINAEEEEKTSTTPSIFMSLKNSISQSFPGLTNSIQLFSSSLTPSLTSPNNSIVNKDVNDDLKSKMKIIEEGLILCKVYNFHYIKYL